MTNAPKLRTGSLARKAGVGLQTILYYDKRGLVKPNSRTEFGHRLYEEAAVRTIRFIKNAQSLGFTLDDISTLLHYRGRKNSGSASVRRKTQLRLEAIRAELKEIKSRERRLSTILNQCSGGKTKVEGCPILNAIESSALR
ncbi:MAG: heavy metal-responsive transcriptional regulator [Elusimicrobia bacterium]|nr:MAG: heavy metal-responsive transcriptional regulator [Elusimicrobiota bacterium]